MIPTKDIEAPFPSGFDAAAESKDHDWLNRWAFAREIFGIATTGPRDWSVRIGVYGEWGSGKTSVLNFVEAMATEHDHVPIHFNPWQFSSTDALWSAFVRDIYTALRKVAKGGKLPKELHRKGKAIFQTVHKIIPPSVGLFNSGAGKITEAGLEILKKYLTFSQADLEELRGILGDKRLIILVDDLDRTNPKLIPEMLFALKEIMDVPGIAFICAFDPVIVGEVLGEFHPGFGNGLKFLEKIVDYPRWLPAATRNQLVALAEADAKRYCPFLPQIALQHSAEMLPQNPRAIRQFIRLIALLSPQIERHRSDEINWPILLAGNVIKIRFPRIGYKILEDETFWRDVYITRGTQRDEDRYRKMLVDTIQKKVEQLSMGDNSDLSTEEKTQLQKILEEIGNTLSPWFGLTVESLVYQFCLAEKPAAVTWKEFDGFIAKLSNDTPAATVKLWLDQHAKNGDQSEDQVYRELFQAAVIDRKACLSRAADTREAANVNPEFKKAEILMNLIEILALELGRIDEEESRLNERDLEVLWDSLKYYYSWRKTSEDILARNQEADLLIGLVSSWKAKIQPWMDILKIGSGYDYDHDSKEWKELATQIRSIVLVKFGAEIVFDFQTAPNFPIKTIHNQENGWRARPILVDPNGPLWKECRSQILAALNNAADNETLRRNAYDLLEWFKYLIRSDESESASVKRLLSDKSIAQALWIATTCIPLNLKAVGGIREMPNIFQELKVEITIPDWWKNAIEQITN